ncbi:DNA polymerase III polC-type [Chlamydia abortus]|nr:DNA polymerase III polC-type [Chlamydia abortus]
MGKICVAVSDSRYVYDYQKLIHDIYINTPSLGGGLHKLEKYRKYCKTYFRLLTTQEMLDEFAFLRNQDLVKEIVIDNTYEIANQIEKNIEIIKNKLYIPKFDESDKKLEELVYKEALERYGKNIDPIIAERIHKELSSIIKYGYSVIY